MIELGRHGGREPTALKAIAGAEGLPLSYLEHVVADLKRAGLVTATRGAHGGYRGAPGGGDRDGRSRARPGGFGGPDGLLRHAAHRARVVLPRGRRRPGLLHAAPVD